VPIQTVQKYPFEVSVYDCLDYRPFQIHGTKTYFLETWSSV